MEMSVDGFNEIRLLTQLEGLATGSIIHVVHDFKHQDAGLDLHGTGITDQKAEALNPLEPHP